MRIVLLLLSCTFVLLASVKVEVKRYSVEVSLNDKNKILEKDSEVSLKPGDTICLKSDKGKLIIDNKYQITKRSKNKCYIVMEEKESPINIGNITNKIKDWADTSEEVSVASTRNNGKLGLPEQIVLLENTFMEFVSIKLDRQCNPPPVTLTLYDADEKVINVKTKKESATQIVNFSTKRLKDVKRIHVVNDWGDEQNITIIHQQGVVAGTENKSDGNVILDKNERKVYIRLGVEK